MSWLCIDAGTSVIKAVLIDGEGKELAVARQRVPVARPFPGHAEQDMTAVWEAVVRAANEITQQPHSEIEGVVTTAQGDGCWLVDPAGRPSGSAILWNDGRAHEIVESWRRAGVLQTAFRHSGSLAYPGLANAILHWLQEHDPDRLERSRWMLSCNGWLYLQLTAKVSADLSDASNPFCDVVTRQYSPDLLRLYGLERQARLLPEFPSRQRPVAALCRSAAEALGVRADVPVVMAPYDIVTTAIGSGCTTAGQGCLILGTTICPEVISSDSGRNGVPAGTTVALNEAGLYLRAMPTLTGCEALDWAAATLRAEDLDDLSHMAASSVPGAHGVLCLPYLSPAGERSPFLAPSARASLLGLSLTHTREDVARAVFEGLTFTIRDCFSAASSTALERVTVCGGGSRNAFWCQLIADVCGCEVLRPDSSETGARGAFFSAVYATGRAASLAEVVQRCGVDGEVYRPAPDRAGTYANLFSKFLRVRETVAETW
jgi:erythritol kinase